MEKLKPCPFCQSNKVSTGRVLGFGVTELMWSVFCDSCGAAGPRAIGSKSESKAAAAWNRSDPQALADAHRAGAVEYRKALHFAAMWAEDYAPRSEMTTAMREILEEDDAIQKEYENAE